MTKKSAKEYATRIFTKYEKGFDGVDGRDVTDMGMCLQVAYQVFFGVPFPHGVRVENRITTMCRCIIDGKPYDPEQVTG